MKENIGQGCGCLLVCVGVAVLLSSPAILVLIGKLIDKL